MYLGQQAVCPRTEMACANTTICNRESQETCAHTTVTVSMHCTLLECKFTGAGRYDAEWCVGRGQVNNQLAADPADNFTPRTETLGHTCVNCIRVGAISNCTPPFPSFPLRSTLMSLWKWSGLVAVLVRTSYIFDEM